MLLRLVRPFFLYRRFLTWLKYTRLIIFIVKKRCYSGKNLFFVFVVTLMFNIWEYNALSVGKVSLNVETNHFKKYSSERN